jgi:hypothetical protein
VKKHAVVSCLAAVLLAARLGAEDDSVVASARVYVRAAQEAQKAGRVQAALEALLAASALRPQHGGIVFELGAAYAAVGRLDEAAQTLERAAAMGTAAATENRPDLAACRPHPACAAALAAIGRNRQPKTGSTVAFTFTGPGLLPEGLAYDPGSDAFFVSSVRERRILRLDKSRAPHPFADRSAGLWAALGMAVDVPRRRLWVATAALAEMADGTAAEEGRSALLALSLDSGHPVARYELPHDRPHVLGDVIVSPAGDVFTTDSTSPAIYRLPAGASALETIAAGEPFVSVQGLALSSDGQRLFVADYAKGIFAIDLGSRRVRLLEAPRTAGILGIDGLYRAGAALLGIQNGTDPPRLLRLAIEGDRITSVEVVDSAHPVATDPTLGVVVGDRFFYIGNSQWAAAQAGGKMDPAVKPEDPVILGLGLR